MRPERGRQASSFSASASAAAPGSVAEASRASKPASSSKLDKARELGLSVLDEAGLLALLASATLPGAAAEAEAENDEA